MKYHIQVTQEDIDKGVRESSTSCPIALAMTRVFNKRISVGRTYVFVGDRDILLPQELQHFVFKFDNSFSVDPIDFDIDIPNPCTHNGKEGSAIDWNGICCLCGEKVTLNTPA